MARFRDFRSTVKVFSSLTIAPEALRQRIQLADSEGQRYNDRREPLLGDTGRNEQEEAQTGNTTDAQLPEVEMDAAQDEDGTGFDEFS